MFVGLTIAIVDDIIPENDEVLVVELREPEGGATIQPGGGSVDVIIMANDYVSGLLAFTQTAYLVTEGWSNLHCSTQMNASFVLFQNQQTFSS